MLPFFIIILFPYLHNNYILLFLLITETYDCPRITSTPPPYPSATSTNAGIAPTSSSSCDTASSILLDPTPLHNNKLMLSTSLTRQNTSSLHKNNMSNLILSTVIGTVLPLLILSVIIVITICVCLIAKKKSDFIVNNPAYILHSQKTSHKAPDVQHVPVDVDKANDIALTENNAYAMTSGGHTSWKRNATAMEGKAMGKNETYSTIIGTDNGTYDDASYYDYIIV